MASSTNNALLLPAQSGDTNLLDIRPLKGPVEIPSTLDWLLWGGVLLAVALLAVFLWRKFRIQRPTAAPVVMVPPHRRAKDRLRGAGELISDPYRFCSLVSDVLRGYVEERFELHAPDRTTEEFMAELRASTKLRAEHKSLLEDFLARCDLVKFARFEPSLPELQALLDSAERFIDETAPYDGTPVASPEQQKAA
jgi:hypothetical protein